MLSYDEAAALFRNEAAIRAIKEAWDEKGENPLKDEIKYTAIDSRVELKIDRMIYSSLESAVDLAEQTKKAIQAKTSQKAFDNFTAYFNAKEEKSAAPELSKNARECIHSITQRSAPLTASLSEVRAADREFRNMAKHYKMMKNTVLKTSLDIEAVQDRLMNVKAIQYSDEPHNSSMSAEAAELRRLGLIEHKNDLESRIEETGRYLDYIEAVIAEISPAAKPWCIMVYLDGMPSVKVAKVAGMTPTGFMATLAKPVYRAVCAVKKPEPYTPEPWIVDQFRDKPEE